MIYVYLTSQTGNQEVTLDSSSSLNHSVSQFGYIYLLNTLLRSGPHLWPELLLLINLVLPGSSCSNLPDINYFPLLKKKKSLHLENPLVPHYLECKLLSLALKTRHNPASATFSSVTFQSFTSESYTLNTLVSSFPDLATNPSEHLCWCFPQPSIPSPSLHRQINTQPSRFGTFSVKLYLHLQVN